MSEQQKIRVLIVDDHPVVRAGIGAIVGYQEDFELVGAAANAAEAIGLFESRVPDVTLVDLSLPDLGGIELISLLRAKSPRARFLVLTANAGGSEIEKALQAGAQAYLFKNAPSEELMGAIRTVHHGGRYLSPAVGLKAEEAATQPELTARELEVLHWIVRGHSNQQIGLEIGVSEDTVKFHVKNILGKLGVGSRSKAVALSLKSGLMQSNDI
ncbi:DNA-binding response regulator [Pseudoxanthomonas yeongjuensis]|uniref:response regulator n=1 Tax=Pseudoxanthomonas yeongjuensis TaxID=377616 RepID=UPI0013915E91|nr:response regulator transcription factor [Pseudoxanthomonas yeongjuensis]KAF1716364.1 DNA-binding response regulator [Pseudoxanthomonas yeongjuensis]